ncbi:MAG: type VII secretion target [Actinomycetota bacterium]|nr:type VII secretion target [Actinomycetota bacterium]
MLVDPDVLRSLSAQSAEAAAGIGTADVAGVTARAADGLNGSTTQWATRLIATHLHQQSESLVENMDAIGKAVRGAGDTFNVTDQDLAAGLNGLWR